MTGEWPGPTGDADATVILPAVPYNPTLAGVAPPAATSVGYEVDPSATTVEQPIIVEPEEGTGAAVARHGTVMAAGSIVSRITGFIRTAAIGAAIGAAAVGNDYNLANTLPGMVYELLLGGVLASVVVPLLVRARTRDADRGEAYTQRLLSLAAVFLAGATVVAVICAPLFTLLLKNDSTSAPDRHLITTLSYLMLPQIFFYGMAALFAAVLNTRGHFAMPMWAPILNNFVVIAIAGTFVILPGPQPPTAAALTPAQLLVLGIGTTLGIVVQAAGLWPALRRVGFRWRWRRDFRQLHLRELGRVGAWMLVYVLVSQVAVVVILKLAQMAADRGVASGRDVAGPAIYNNAFLVFMMAHGIIAVSIITALMPRMAAAVAQNRHEDLAYQLSLGTRLTAVVLLPATAAYLVLGRPLAVTLFEWRSYNHSQAVDTGWVIAAAGVGLVPFAISQLQIFAFYAMPDTRTPAVLNVPVVAVRIGLDVLLFVILPVAWVVAGLMVGSTVSFVVGVLIGYVLLRRRVGRLDLGRIFATVGRLTLASAIAAAPAALVVYLMVRTWGDAKVASAIELVVGALVLIAVYIVAAVALRVREVRELGTMLRARLGR
jgi:putative peptidoglycan lipid II flippase